MKLRPAWAEVDLRAIAHNIKEFRRITGPQKFICAVVKANAYGHGAVEVSKVVLSEGADYLAVAVLDEAIELREAGIKAPILILGYTDPEYAEELVGNNLTQTIFRYDLAKAISDAAVKAGKTRKIHIKIDSGMGRVGFLPGPEGLETVKSIASLPNIVIEGIYTHFASADEVDKSYTLKQLNTFLEFVKRLEEAGIRIPIKHAANSAATIDLPEAHLDMVRPGISLYGLYPSEEVNKQIINLKPAMTLKAKIVQVKDISSGTAVSYGLTWKAEQRTTVATLPLGYADGFTRLLSNKGEVLIHGQRAQIIGRVCMDQCLVDVNHISEVQAEDEVVLLGAQEGAEITAEEVAGKIGTINYEIVCMISNRVPRIYIK